MAKRSRQTTFPGMDEADDAPATAALPPAKARAAAVSAVDAPSSIPTVQADGTLSIADWTVYVVDSH